MPDSDTVGLLAEEGRFSPMDTTTKEEEEEEEEAKPLTLSGKALVLVLFAILTSIATLEKVALKKATDSLTAYQVFLNQLIVAMFIIVFSGVVVYKLNKTDDISEEMRAFPKWKFALISICDTLAGILILIPARHVNGDLMTLLLQGVVPATLFFSRVILKKHFHLLHYIGCLVIILGILLNTWPEINSAHGDVTGGSPWYILPLFLSCIPAALSGICAEIALKGQDMDIYYYQLWVAICQFCLSAVLSPVSFLLQSPDKNISELPQNIIDGVKCWVPGIDHVEPECDDGFSSVAIYLGLCIVFNIFISLVVKYGGAVTMMVALTMAVPLQYLVFAVKVPYFVPTSTPVGWLNIVGLVVTVVGLVGYHWAKEPDQEEEEATDESARALTRSRMTTMSPSMAPFTPRLVSTPRTGGTSGSYVKARRAELLSTSTPNQPTSRSLSVGRHAKPVRMSEAPF